MSTCKSGKWPSRVSNGDTAAPAQQPVAYITDTEQGPMVWTPEMYDEACTYCDDDEFPVPLYTAAPAPQPAHQGERAELIRRLLAIANTEANEVADALNEAADMLQSAQPVAQPLTLEQILDIVKKLDETPDMSHVDVLKTFARAIEAAHGIREVK